MRENLPTEGREFPLRPDRTRLIRFGFSLLLAVLIWGWVTELNDPFITVKYRELDIATGSLDDSLQIVTTLPRASVTLRGPESSLNRIQRNEISVMLETNSVTKPGEYRLKLVVITPDGPTERSVDPRELTVQVEKDVTQVMPLEASVIIPEGDQRKVTSTEPETTQVTVSGPSSAVARVEKVVLPVSIDTHSSSFTESFTPYAVDKNDQRVSEVTVLPGQIRTRVEIQTRGKRVSVIAEVNGVPAEGFSMRQRSVIPDSVVVDGPESELASLLFVNTESVDITGATQSISREVGLANLPPGVTVIEPASGRVEVRVAIEDTTSTAQTLTDLPVQIVNLDPSYDAALSSPTMAVTVDGPSSTLSRMTPSDVLIRLDLTDLGPGTHQVKPEITVPQGVSWLNTTPQTIQVTITSANEKSMPSPQASPSPQAVMPKHHSVRAAPPG